MTNNETTQTIHDDNIVLKFTRIYSAADDSVTDRELEVTITMRRDEYVTSADFFRETVRTIRSNMSMIDWQEQTLNRWVSGVYHHPYTYLQEHTVLEIVEAPDYTREILRAMYNSAEMW